MQPTSLQPSQAKGPTINARGTFMPPVAAQGAQKRKIYEEESNNTQIETGNMNQDSFINVQDIIILINLILQ